MATDLTSTDWPTCLLFKLHPSILKHTFISTSRDKRLQLLTLTLTLIDVGYSLLACTNNWNLLALTIIFFRVSSFDRVTGPCSPLWQIQSLGGICFLSKSLVFFSLTNLIVTVSLLADFTSVALTLQLLRQFAPMSEKNRCSLWEP